MYIVHTLTGMHNVYCITIMYIIRALCMCAVCILYALRTWCVLKCIYCVYYMLYVHGVY